MDYFSILKLNSNATIIDIIGMYEVLLKNTKKEIKAGKSDISKLNELNMAFILACTTKNKDELINVKNKYILNNKVIIIINKIKQTITTFKSASNIGFGIYFNKLIEILNEYLKGYYRLINQIRQAKNLDEFNKITKEFKEINWSNYFITNLNDISKNILMPGLYYTKEHQQFLYDLKRITNNLELISFLNNNIKYIEKLEIINETLANNIFYNNYDTSKLSYQELNIISSKINKIIIEDVIIHHLTIDELVCKYNSSMIENTQKRLVKELGFPKNYM